MIKGYSERFLREKAKKMLVEGKEYTVKMLGKILEKPENMDVGDFLEMVDRVLWIKRPTLRMVKYFGIKRGRLQYEKIIRYRIEEHGAMFLTYKQLMNLYFRNGLDEYIPCWLDENDRALFEGLLRRAVMALMAKDVSRMTDGSNNVRKSYLVRKDGEIEQAKAADSKMARNVFTAYRAFARGKALKAEWYEKATKAINERLKTDEVYLCQTMKFDFKVVFKNRAVYKWDELTQPYIDDRLVLIVEDYATYFADDAAISDLLAREFDKWVEFVRNMHK